MTAHAALLAWIATGWAGLRRAVADDPSLPAGVGPAITQLPGPAREADGPLPDEWRSLVSLLRVLGGGGAASDRQAVEALRQPQTPALLFTLSHLPDLRVRRAHRAQQPQATPQARTLRKPPATAAPADGSVLSSADLIDLASLGLAGPLLRCGQLPFGAHTCDTVDLVDAVETLAVDRALVLLEREDLFDGPDGEYHRLLHAILWLGQSLLAGLPPDRSACDRFVKLLRGPTRLSFVDLAAVLHTPLRELSQPTRGHPETVELSTLQSWLSWTPVRRRLILGDHAGASELLAQRRQHLERSPLDDFFAARIELLAGRETQGRALLEASWHQARRHGLARRLEAELRLARDLMPSRIIGIFSSNFATPQVRPRASGRELVGRSTTMAQLRERISRAATADLPVLLRGPTGSGKELAARAIHDGGARAGRPFVPVNCASIPDALLGSELFGHRRGAFSGANDHRPGLIAAAADGTLFLDEIGDLPLPVQATLLRLLDTGEYRPVGADAVLHAPCRIIAATNAQLETMVIDGQFRDDLLHRLRRIEIQVPGLDQRRDDIPVLAEHFLQQLRGDDAPELDEELAVILSRLDWPGNVRQLRNEIESAALLAGEADSLDPEAFALALAERVGGAERAARVRGAPLATTLTASATATASPDTLDLADNDRESRIAQLLALFESRGRLTRKETMAQLGISQSTATLYLRELIDSGAIVRIEPTRAPASHYFVLAGGEELRS